MLLPNHTLQGTLASPVLVGVLSATLPPEWSCKPVILPLITKKRYAMATWNLTNLSSVCLSFPLYCSCSSNSTELFFSLLPWGIQTEWLRLMNSYYLATAERKQDIILKLLARSSMYFSLIFSWLKQITKWKRCKLDQWKLPGCGMEILARHYWQVMQTLPSLINTCQLPTRWNSIIFICLRKCVMKWPLTTVSTSPPINWPQVSCIPIILN